MRTLQQKKVEVLSPPLAAQHPLVLAKAHELAQEQLVMHTRNHDSVVGPPHPVTWNTHANKYHLPVEAPPCTISNIDQG